MAVVGREVVSKREREVKGNNDTLVVSSPPPPPQSEVPSKTKGTARKSIPTHFGSIAKPIA